MSRKEKKIAIAILITIIICSSILVVKIKISEKQNLETNKELYTSYKDAMEENESDDEEKTEENEDTDNSQDEETTSNNNESVYMTITADGKKYRVAGEINIPKIGLNHPIIYETTEQNLKIAPTKLSGPNLNEPGNVCIVGHNYNNNQFFSRLSELRKDDKVNLIDNKGKKMTYYVYDRFEVEETDFSCIAPNYSGEYELTLITCTVRKNNRLVVKCKAET